MDTILRSRVRQATWLFLIFAYVVAFAGGVIGVSTFPSAGATYEVRDGELVITGFEPGSHLWTEGARTGAVVEQINGLTAVDAFASGARVDNVTFRPPGSAPGDNLKTVQVSKSTASLINSSISLNILGVAFAVLAVLIYLRASRSTETVMFALMGMSAAVSFSISTASVANQPWGRVAMGASIYVSATAFIGFFISFTRPWSDRFNWLRTWLPELVIAAFIVLVVPWALTVAGVVDLFPVLRPGMLILLAVSLLGAVGLLAYRLRTAERHDQEQLRIVTLGTAVGLVPFIWLSVIPMLVTGTEILKGEIAVLGVILIPVSFAYAISKHSLMGIRRLFHRGAAYALITAAIVVVYGSVLTVLNLLAPDSEAIGTVQAVLFVLMFAGAPAISSVRRQALRLVDRLLYEGAVTQEDLVSAISTVSANETTVDGTLDRAISFTGQGFDVEYAALVSYGPDGAHVEHMYNNPGSEIVRGLEAVAQQHSRGVRRSILPGTDQAILIGTLREVGREPRAIVLGPKANEDIFTEEEVSLLETVCAVVSTALTRIHLLGEVHEQSEQLKNMGTQMQNIQELERQEISSYLHDEPLQKLAYVNARVSENESVSDDLKQLLQDVVRDLRGTSASLSPEMLRSHGLMSALKWLLQDQQQRGPFRVFLEVGGIADDERFNDDVELTMYRSVQEALNNCRKHAQAKSVWVKLLRNEEQLELSVEDNGVGIKATTQDIAERRPDQGLGIRGLKQRIINLGGTLAVLPRSSRGTAFIVRLPLNDAELRAAS